MSEQRERRKRKWDVQGDPSTIPPEIQAGANIYSNVSNGSNDTTSADSVIAAASAAARINAMMIAKGMGAKDSFSRDVSINECRADIRYLLTKGQTHEQIQKETGCTIVTKGRFKPAGDTSFESPLYLHLVAETMDALDRAAEKIRQMMHTGSGNSVKVVVGIDPLAEPKFPLIGKLLGPKGSFVKHIAGETQTKVQLKGKGSGYFDGPTHVESTEPLYLHIMGQTQKSVDDAKVLAENLVTHVKQEFADFVKTKAQQPPPAPAMGYPPPYGHQYAQQYPPGAYNPYAYNQAYAAAYAQGYPQYGAYPNPGAYAYGHVPPPGTQPAHPPNQYPPPASYDNSSDSPSSSDSIAPPGTTAYPPPSSSQPSYPPYPQAYPQQQQQPLKGSDRYDPRNPRSQDYQPQFQEEEPAQKRRFQEKKEAPAVGPHMASAEEMAAYALPEPSDIPPHSSEGSKNARGKYVEYDPSHEQDTAREDDYHNEAEPQGGISDYATAYNLKKQRQQQQQQQSRQPQQTDNHNTYNNINNANHKPAAQPARPFWALGPESVTPDKPKQPSGKSDNDYDDVYNQLGIKKGK